MSAAQIDQFSADDEDIKKNAYAIANARGAGLTIVMEQLI